MTNENGIDETSLDETLANLTLILKKKQQALEEREIALEKATLAFKNDRTEVFGDKSQSVLNLNVGGDKLSVLRRTLTSVEGLLIQLLSFMNKYWDVM